MSLNAFRNKFIFILLASKLVVILWAFFLWMTMGFNYSQLKEILFLIIPLFFLLITMAIPAMFQVAPKAFQENNSIGIKGSVRGMIFAGAIFYSLYQIIVLSGFSIQSADDISFVNTKEMVAWGEALFAVYFGYLIQSLLGQERYLNENQALLASVKEIQESVDLKAPGAKLTDKEANVLKELIAKGKTEEAIMELKDFLIEDGDSKNLLNKVIILSAQYHKFIIRYDMKLTNDKSIANNVNYVLLGIIDDMRSD